jgi:hypothetical protein
VPVPADPPSPSASLLRATNRAARRWRPADPVRDSTMKSSARPVGRREGPPRLSFRCRMCLRLSARSALERRRRRARRADGVEWRDDQCASTTTATAT